MGYKRKVWNTPNGRVVEEYHSGKRPPPGGRAEKKKATPEQMARANQRAKERNTQILIMANFSVDDYFSTLTFRIELRPEDMKECKKQFAKMIRKVKREYESLGHELKWIRTIEKGPRGGWHIHLIVNRIEGTDIILRRAWGYGGVVNSLLYLEGGFKKLAEYMAKEPEKGESSFSSSRNLIRPKAKIKEMSGKTFYRRRIRVPAGYYLDKESMYEGINAYTGYPYRYYTLLILTDRRRE